MNQTVKSPLIDTILRIVVLFLLIAWCIGIILPFLEPVIWGGVIAITLYPFFATAKRWVGDRDTLAGVLLTLLMIIALSDNVLKPLLMGKGSTVPMLVIFLGAIGGFVFSGFIGLFTGAIVVSVGYNLMVHWVGEGRTKPERRTI